MRALAVLGGLVALTLSLLAVGPPIGVFGDQFFGGPAANAGTRAAEKSVSIIATPIRVPATQLIGLREAGAWDLRADNIWFGGLSGLLIEGDRLIAASDRAHLLRARFAVDGEALRIEGATLWHLRDQRDHLLGDWQGDAESLARADGHLLISFERDHRIQRMDGDARLRDWARPVGTDALQANGGIEALAGLRDGRVLAFAERPVEGQTLWWLLDVAGGIDRGGLVLTSSHRITGATLGPDDRLYMVLRDFSVATGVSIRIQRMTLADGRPMPGSIETLAAFENLSGIDNMEGIAIADGYLWILSDNNFSAGQRTLLLRFALSE